jgi:phytoene desaturase
MSKKSLNNFSMSKKKAIIIGSGIGGLSLAIRLQAMGYQTTVLEKLDKAGGRAYQKSVTVEGVGEFKFDMGPTVLTVPHFIEELFALQPGDKTSTREQDYTVEAWQAIDLQEGLSVKLDEHSKNNMQKAESAHSTNSLKEGAQNWQTSPTFASTNHTQNYVQIVPITPFYRIYFADKTYFDYDGDLQNTMKQIKELTGLDSEVEGFIRFQKDALQVFKRGFMELGYTHFTTPWDMIKIIPDLMKLDVVRGLFGYVSKYFKHPKTQQIFSFEPLLIGGNPNTVPALYVMIHFVEKTWRVHYAMGGTGALVQGFVKKLQELGGQIKLNSEVEKILIEDNKAVGVLLKNGQQIHSDIVCSNADYAYTYETLVQKPKLFNNKFKTEFLTTYSMSLFVIYFAFKEDPKHPLNLRHHNIILGGEYQSELEAIFKTGRLHPKFSQYLHIPTYTDKSMAPEGYHTAYTLVCVPNKKQGRHDWANQSEEFMHKILNFIEEKGYIPELSKRLVHKSFINPDYFETTLNSKFGNAFGVSPILRQSAFFRPQNKSRDVKNLYCVGANFQPGAGTPSVMMSAKMTARIIEKDHFSSV